MGAEKPLAGGIEREKAGHHTAAWDLLDLCEGAGAPVGGEDGEEVGAAGAGVEELAVGGEDELGGGVGGFAVRGEAGAYTGGEDRDGCTERAAEAAADAVLAVLAMPLVDGNGAVEFVDAEEPAAVGVEGEMAGAGAGLGSEAARGAEKYGLAGVDGKDEDTVVAEVTGEDEIVVWRDDGAVEMGAGLTVVLWAGGAASGGGTGSTLR